ncbi:sensor histidine kinase [Corynebacterium heidelbergense]|uniref:Signal transduction histidine kinase subgroup 3 dimerisation and phosphoacceptor domain-containing protein n=1 Tax=Corynebacterium heidelbergense TaxID=2055947 RepID=A0A364VC59_9CORY|nr:histidine kinase [Corynebacterium heidelbergense]RAV34242.1 hypothetical protein CWC39_04375 [Corynebacterium heidelbergense]WCZ35791.1 Sensor histidine kinase DesK [Corynebacterium heidelbergense]
MKSILPASSTARYALMTRTSLQVSYACFFLVFAVVFYDGYQSKYTATEGLFPLLVSMGAMVAATLLGLVEFGIAPRLHVDKPANNPRRFLGSMALCAAIIAVGLFALTVGSEVWRVAGYYSAVWSAITLGFAFIPWLSHKWWWWLGLAVIITVFCRRWGLWPPLIGVLSSTPTTLLSAWGMDVIRELERSRRLEASLRVSEERLRIAQELHDTMGQHLAAISVKAELAKALAQRDDSRFLDEIKAIQQLAATSTAEMRQVVQGYREIDLSVEWYRSIELLKQAGIEVCAEGSPTAVPQRFHVLAAWFIREAATNVLRHSQATHTKFRVSEKEISVYNDGAHLPVGPPGGLDSIRRRGEALGTTVTLQRDPRGTFLVTLGLPEQREA